MLETRCLESYSSLSNGGIFNWKYVHERFFKGLFGGLFYVWKAVYGFLRLIRGSCLKGVYFSRNLYGKWDMEIKVKWKHT